MRIERAAPVKVREDEDRTSKAARTAALAQAVAALKGALNDIAPHPLELQAAMMVLRDADISVGSAEDALRTNMLRQHMNMYIDSSPPTMYSAGTSTTPSRTNNVTDNVEVSQEYANAERRTASALAGYYNADGDINPWIDIIARPS